MADQALFPLNEVSDDAAGHAAVVSCDREQFLDQMRGQVGAGAVATRAERHPVFLDANLVFVVTDAEYTLDGKAVPMRYGDLLVRTAGGWRFQTMVAGGWG